MDARTLIVLCLFTFFMLQCSSNMGNEEDTVYIDLYHIPKEGIPKNESWPFSLQGKPWSLSIDVVDIERKGKDKNLLFKAKDGSFLRRGYTQNGLLGFEILIRGQMPDHKNDKQQRLEKIRIQYFPDSPSDEYTKDSHPALVTYYYAGGMGRGIGYGPSGNILSDGWFDRKYENESYTLIKEKEAWEKIRKK